MAKDILNEKKLSPTQEKIYNRIINNDISKREEHYNKRRVLILDILALDRACFVVMFSCICFVIANRIGIPDDVTLMYSLVIGWVLFGIIKYTRMINLKKS